jgi:hypothetical protein
MTVPVEIPAVTTQHKNQSSFKTTPTAAIIWPQSTRPGGSSVKARVTITKSLFSVTILWGLVVIMQKKTAYIALYKYLFNEVPPRIFLKILPPNTWKYLWERWQVSTILPLVHHQVDSPPKYAWRKIRARKEILLLIFYLKYKLISQKCNKESHNSFLGSMLPLGSQGLSTIICSRV